MLVHVEVFPNLEFVITVNAFEGVDIVIGTVVFTIVILLYLFSLPDKKIPVVEL